MINPSSITEKIKLVAETLERPNWTVIVPTFNCASYLVHTLKSILDQDPGEDKMEIIVVDDHSTKDDPESVVKSFKSRAIKFIQQPSNVGKSANYLTGLKESKGKYIHILHGDDTVNKGFYKKSEQLFASNPQAGATFCGCNYMDENGLVLRDTGTYQEAEGNAKDFINRIAVWQLLQPPCVVFKREVYETIGAYDPRLKYIEDWEFYVRAAVHYDFAYSPEKLANYRIFAQNSSSKSVKKGRRLKTMLEVETIIDGYLPTDVKHHIKKDRDQAFANYVLNLIPRMVVEKDLQGWFKYSVAFFKKNKDTRLLGRWLRFSVQASKYFPA